MKTLKVSQCKKNLDFKPLKAWPANLPVYAWGEELLCGFQVGPDHEVVNLEAPGISIAELIFDIYQTLSLPELARIFKLQTSLAPQFDFDRLLEKNSLRASESFSELLLKLSQTPLEFQNWVGDRKLGARELFVLKSINNVSDIEILLRQITERALTRQLGIQILENACELFLMNPDLDQLLIRKNESNEVWSQRLEQLRNPMRSAQLEKKQNDLAQFSWPKFLNARVVGSEASLVNEVRMQFRTQGELKRNIEALQKIQIEFEARSAVKQMNEKLTQ